MLKYSILIGSSQQRTKVHGQRRTKLLCLRTIRFFLNGHLLSHDNTSLSLADCVSITFEFQKTDIRDETITHYRSKDLYLCPVRAWATVVQHILTYPGTDHDSPVNTFQRPDGSLTQITSVQIKLQIRSAVAAIGRPSLGFGPEDVGTHSVRSAAAMAMVLAGCQQTYIIMLIGRWSSDAFLLYIRKQIQELTANISEKMISLNQFHVLPPSVTHNHPSSLTTTLNFGPSQAHRHVLTPSFHLHT
jgi:hypothetical protein